MKKAILGLCGILCAAAVGIGPVRAAEQKSHPYVVVVGVSNYADPQIKPRPHAETDATALYDLFTDKRYLGVAPAHAKLLLGKPDAKAGSEAATHENIIKAVRWAATKAKKDDLLVLAFFGEGAPLNERSCYLASDSTFKDRAKNAVAATDIEHALEKLQSRKMLVLIDVNFKGFDTGKDPSPELNVQNFYQMREYLGADEDEPATGRVILLATRGFTSAVELKDHDVFSKVILDGLKGAADKDGYEPDGAVTVDELVEYLDKEVPHLNRQNGKNRDERDQLPLVFAGEGSHFVLTHNPAVTATLERRLEKVAELEKSGQVTAEQAEEGRKLLALMPKLKSYQSLRKSWESLADAKIDVAAFARQAGDIREAMKLEPRAARSYAAKVVHATELITSEYVKDVVQGELIAWGIRGLYQRIEEKIPPELKERLDKAKDLDEKELTQLLTDARANLGRRDDLDNHKDLDFTLQRMLTHLDPYTTYIDPEALARFRQETSGNFYGVGISIRKETNRDMLYVVTPLMGSPAYKAGIKAGDVITAIKRDMDSSGSPLAETEVTSTKGLALGDAVKKILGIKGTYVTLTVEREGVSKPLDFKLRRELIHMESVIGVKRNADDSFDYLIDSKNRIAYVRLTSFADDTSRDLAEVLAQLKKNGGIRGFILDLRYNPGGLLQSAVEISDMFIDDGLIVKIRNRAGQEQSYSGQSEGSYLDFPMVCLINGGSASGSEIVSACLQDHRRAVLIGERSYGKGSVQNLQNFEGGKLKLTTASYWRPSGKNIHRFPHAKETDEWGVTPDKMIKLNRKEREELIEAQHNQEVIPRRDVVAKEPAPEFKDRQLDAALSYLRDQIKTAARDSSNKDG
jgi:C-terminal peptidase prc